MNRCCEPTFWSQTNANALRDSPPAERESLNFFSLLEISLNLWHKHSIPALQGQEDDQRSAVWKNLESFFFFINPLTSALEVLCGVGSSSQIMLRWTLSDRVAVRH